MFSGEEGYMCTLGLHNQSIIAFNLVTHIVYYDTTEAGQTMLRGASVHHPLEIFNNLDTITFNWVTDCN